MPSNLIFKTNDIYGYEDNFVKGTFVGDVADTSRPAQYKLKFVGFKDQMDEKQNFEDYWN